MNGAVRHSGVASQDLNATRLEIDAAGSFPFAEIYRSKGDAARSSSSVSFDSVVWASGPPSDPCPTSLKATSHPAHLAVRPPAMGMPSSVYSTLRYCRSTREEAHPSAVDLPRLWRLASRAAATRLTKRRALRLMSSTRASKRRPN